MVLTLIFVAVSSFLTALVYAGGLSPWWILPVWIGFYVAAVLLYVVLLLSGLYFLVPRSDPSPSVRRATHCVMKLTLRWALMMLGMRVELEGTEKLPDTPYLWVGNHRSAFDPICTVAALSSHIVFVAKPGVLKIPVIGTLMSRLCFLAIDRDNARNAVTTIKRAAELIKEVGLCVGIYPEGTRSKDGNLLPLHAGSFKIAKLADCPVVVTSIQHRKNPILPWVRRVQIRVVDVMDMDFVAESNTAAMVERAETAIREDLHL